MKQLQSNAPANNTKTKNEVAIMPLEVQTYLPLHTQDPGRTEYMAPVSDRNDMTMKYIRGYNLTCATRGFFYGAGICPLL